ncbi:hypothetical protein MRB53_025863 [Persea americana]|uniref:Uncharacterized protein n=1 Tax=Persea americana TaxID=3435 RepID=A0ACC2LGM0_PERAE|nr:hypothetical protein MRB53_025863 [Persea americana]
MTRLRQFAIFTYSEKEREIKRKGFLLGRQGFVDLWPESIELRISSTSSGKGDPEKTGGERRRPFSCTRKGKSEEGVFLDLVRPGLVDLWLESTSGSC